MKEKSDTNKMQAAYSPHLLFDLRKRGTCVEFKMTK